MALTVGAVYELTNYRQAAGGLAYYCLSCLRLFPLRLAGGDPYAFDESWFHEEGCPTGNAERERRSVEYMLVAQSPLEVQGQVPCQRVTLPVELL